MEQSNEKLSISDEEMLDKRQCDWLTSCIKYKHNIFERTLIKNGYSNKIYKLLVRDICHQPNNQELINFADDGPFNFGGHIGKRYVHYKKDMVEYYVDVYVD